MLAEGRTPLASSPLVGVGGQLREKRNAKILWRRFVDKMLDISMEQAATQGNPPVQPGRYDHLLDEFSKIIKRPR